MNWRLYYINEWIDTHYKYPRGEWIFKLYGKAVREYENKQILKERLCDKLSKCKQYECVFVLSNGFSIQLDQRILLFWFQIELGMHIFIFPRTYGVERVWYQQ